MQKSIVIWIYAALVLVGGVIGYVVAGSVASIIASSTFAILLFVSGWFVRKGNPRAYDLSLGLMFFLLVFFAYRFSISYKFMPSGMMAVITLIAFVYLLVRKNRQIGPS